MSPAPESLRSEPEDHLVLAFLLRTHPPFGGGDGPLPDEGLIAGYVEGRLTPEMRSAVEALLVESPEGRLLASAFAGLRA